MIALNLILIGFMGAGKTTIGKYLASENHMNFIDTDELIEQNNSMLIKDIFKNYGEEYFRKLESEAIDKLVYAENTIISVGGGAVMFHNNMEKLRNIGCVIFLNTPIEQIFNNIKGSFRPLVGHSMDKEKTKSLYESRLSTYMKADIVVNTDNLSIAEISKTITEIVGVKPNL